MDKGFVILALIAIVLMIDIRRYYIKGRDEWMEDYITHDEDGFHVWDISLTKIIGGPFSYHWQAKCNLRQYNKCNKYII